MSVSPLEKAETTKQFKVLTWCSVDHASEAQPTTSAAERQHSESAWRENLHSIMRCEWHEVCLLGPE